MLFFLSFFFQWCWFWAHFRQMIQTAIKNTEKGALLTTHYLAEAEAICDRIAIMVSGRLRWVSYQSLSLTLDLRFPMKRTRWPSQLEFFLLAHRYIGSIQHLKNKLGKDYNLELKVKETSQVNLVHSEILKLFPQAAQQERWKDLLIMEKPIGFTRSGVPFLHYENVGVIWLHNKS